MRKWDADDWAWLTLIVGGVLVMLGALSWQVAGDFADRRNVAECMKAGVRSSCECRQLANTKLECAR